MLFVFAEAPGSRPLAARRERRELKRLLEREIYPRRRVAADFLAHGVTRERLEAQIEDRGGYQAKPNALGFDTTLRDIHLKLNEELGRYHDWVKSRPAEALRIDVLQGKAAEALPQVEARLGRVEVWWRQLRAGELVPEAPDFEILARAFIGALDIARQAHSAREDWESALPRIDAILEVKRALERPDEDIARARMNRANVLGWLDRFGEAKAELEACLRISENSPARRARVLSSLAILFNRQGDVGQAVTQVRRALALCEELPDPGDRALSLNNLANYLDRRGTPSDLAESPRHQLAGLVYYLVAGIGQHLRTMLRNYAGRFRRAHSEGVPLAVPRVAELLADPAFRPLDDWLRQRQAGVAEVQAAVDQVLEQARQAAAE